MWVKWGEELFSDVVEKRVFSSHLFFFLDLISGKS